jgi:hypothetical protein
MNDEKPQTAEKPAGAASELSAGLGDGELYMCATDYEYELGMAAGGTGIYASVSDLKATRKCVSECGIVAVRVEFVRVVEPGVPYRERGKNAPNV